MAAEEIFAGLNPEQRAAVEATRGCVCILAGAGTGKTTTITRRIAWQVASGAFVVVHAPLIEVLLACECQQEHRQLVADDVGDAIEERDETIQQGLRH